MCCSTGLLGSGEREERMHLFSPPRSGCWLRQPPSEQQPPRPVLTDRSAVVLLPSSQVPGPSFILQAYKKTNR